MLSASLLLILHRILTVYLSQSISCVSFFRKPSRFIININLIGTRDPDISKSESDENIVKLQVNKRKNVMQSSFKKNYPYPYTLLKCSSFTLFLFLFLTEILFDKKITELITPMMNYTQFSSYISTISRTYVGL